MDSLGLAYVWQAPLIGLWELMHLLWFQLNGSFCIALVLCRPGFLVVVDDLWPLGLFAFRLLIVCCIFLP